MHLVAGNGAEASRSMGLPRAVGGSVNHQGVDAGGMGNWLCVADLSSDTIGVARNQSDQVISSDATLRQMFTGILCCNVHIPGAEGCRHQNWAWYYLKLMQCYDDVQVHD